jgi:CubicO group peptidase (beta-lactamase class C family)
MRYCFFTFAFLFLIVAAPIAIGAQKTSPEEAGLSPEGLEHFANWIEREIEKGQLPMAEAVIYRNGVLGYHEVFGVNDMQAGSALKANQIFHLMSMTKPLVSVAFMMLYEEGHFRLKDKVADFLPEFKDLRVARNKREGIKVATDSLESPITIEQLLTHTAGFSHGLGGTPLDNEIAGALYYRPQASIATRVSTLASLPLVGQPGEQWYYSASPDVLARLIEHFSGMTVLEFMQERLFEPLGMKDTGYNIPSDEAGRMVANHAFTEGTLGTAAMQLPNTGNTVYGGTHGLYSTAADYLRFCRMLLNGGELDGRRYLSPTTVEFMTLNHVGELREPGQGFGLGFGVITDVADSNIAGSVGTYYWSGAYCTYFFIDPAEDLIAIMMSQRSPFSGYHAEMMQQMVYQSIAE